MIDHLVYAVPDLPAGMDAIEALTGVRPAPGGKHQGRGTHNALLSLGDGQYLEVIAPDPEQRVDPGVRAFGLDRPGPPRLVTWAMRSQAIDAQAEAARARGYDPGEVQAMSRDLPGGGRLAWRLTRAKDPAGDGLIPFLIDWGESEHPSRTSPAGCLLLSLRAEHPEPARIRTMLRALGADVAVDAGPAPALIATIETPKGHVELR